MKAIENILLKCQTTKAGQASMEGQQVLTLLNDIKAIQTPTKKGLYQSQVGDGDSPRWRFMETSPHSPGRKPFVGGARQLFNSGVNYKKIISSTPAVRAQRVLDRMPRNILDRDN